MKQPCINTIAALGLALGLGLAGCASSGKPSGTQESAAPSPASAAIIDACDLMTADIAKKLLGPTAHRTMKARPNKHMTHCVYASDAGAISVMVSDDWSMTNVGQENVPGEKPLSGLGDEAHVNPSSLRVRKGTHGLEITATGASGEYWGKAADAQLSAGEALSIAVAKALLPNL